MNIEFEKFIKETPADFPSGSTMESSVHKGNTYRIDKAKEQAKLKNVDKKTVIDYTNVFLAGIGLKKVNNPIMKIDENNKEEFYKNLKSLYELKDVNDIVWMIFTKDGYLGLVAVSADINYDIPKSKDEYSLVKEINGRMVWQHTTKGIIAHSLGKEWDESFVLVFPLSNIPEGLSRHDIEKGIGNFLISKGIPILDYYSHMY